MRAEASRSSSGCPGETTFGDAQGALNRSAKHPGKSPGQYVVESISEPVPQY